MSAATITASQIAADVAARRTTAVAVCEAALDRIAARDPALGALLEVTAAAARQQAAQVDADIAAGRAAGPLAGVPVVLKDNICTTFSRTTAGSKILQNYRSPFDATVVQRILAAGGVIVGKSNLDEFAMGSSTENSAFQQTRNPWNRDCVPGGSSGGSTVAVAARMVPLALGSDTGGSIRQPASLCGVVGLKPTYGRVSRYGLIAYGSSLDQIGPLATCVEDAARMLQTIAGRDSLDTTSTPHATDDYVGGLGEALLRERLSGLRIGLPREYFGDAVDRDVQAAIDTAIRVYEKLGAKVLEVSLPNTPLSIATYYLIATAEASSNLARFDGVHYGHRTAAAGDIHELYAASREEGFGGEVKRRIMLGAFALSAGYHDAFYSKALRVRRLIKNDFDRAFEQCDVLACPGSPTPAFRLGEKSSDPLQMYLADVDTIAVNLAGVPGISISCGFSSGGLPIGLQLIAPLFAERSLLQVARLFERETDWHTRVPPGCE
ncbi:MAG: Asp-tRNA(Asn)/Glu-tRNA(Gln) amidotransferase subunit GatA [Phycisphaerae bacterium]